MRIHHIINIPRRQTPSLQTLDHIRIRRQRLACRCMLLDGRRVPLDVSPQTQVEDEAGESARCRMAVLHEEGQRWHRPAGCRGCGIHKVLFRQGEVAGGEGVEVDGGRCVERMTLVEGDSHGDRLEVRILGILER